MQRLLRTSLDEVSAKDIFDRVLDGVIAFDAKSRLLLSKTDFTRDGSRVVVAPERRSNPFRIPAVRAAKAR